MLVERLGRGRVRNPGHPSWLLRVRECSDRWIKRRRVRIIRLAARTWRPARRRTPEHLGPGQCPSNQESLLPKLVGKTCRTSIAVFCCLILTAGRITLVHPHANSCAVLRAFRIRISQLDDTIAYGASKSQPQLGKCSAAGSSTIAPFVSPPHA
jgi:hypothetical protein